MLMSLVYILTLHFIYLYFNNIYLYHREIIKILLYVGFSLSSPIIHVLSSRHIALFVHSSKQADTNHPDTIFPPAKH